MFGDKVVIWENDIGQSITFDNEGTLFVESIDMTGTSGIHTAEALAMADGQVSVAHHLSAKTIPCSFAWYGEDDDGTMRNTLAQIFNPLQSGTLTVLTKHSDYSDLEQYQIDCRPQNVPTFRRDVNLNIWRFDVDFMADYPYWRKGSRRGIMHEFPTGGALTFSNTACPFVICPVITLPKATTGIFTLNGETFSVLAHDFEVTIDTQNFTVRKTSGTNRDCWEVLNSYVDLSKLRVYYGTNTYAYSATPTDNTKNKLFIWWYVLSMGEV